MNRNYTYTSRTSGSKCGQNLSYADKIQNGYDRKKIIKANYQNN